MYMGILISGLEFGVDISYVHATMFACSTSDEFCFQNGSLELKISRCVCYVN